MTLNNWWNWTHGLIAQSVRASQPNSALVGSNSTQANFLYLLQKILHWWIPYIYNIYNIYVYIYIYIYTYIHTYIYIYICTHILVNTNVYSVTSETTQSSRAVADALRPLRTHQCYGTTEWWTSQKWRPSNSYQTACGGWRVYIFMVMSRVSVNCLKAELCFHCYTHFSCVPIYIFGFHRSVLAIRRTSLLLWVGS